MWSRTMRNKENSNRNQKRKKKKRENMGKRKKEKRKQKENRYGQMSRKYQDFDKGLNSNGRMRNYKEDKLIQRREKNHIF